MGRRFVANWLKTPREFVRRLSEERRTADRSRLGADAADAARRQSDWTAAIAGYGAYLEKRPNDLAIRLRQARTYWAAGQVAEAEAALLRSIALRPDKSELHRELAALRSASPFLAETVDNTRRAFSIGDYLQFRQSMRLPVAPDTLQQPFRILLLHQSGSLSADSVASLEALPGRSGDLLMLDPAAPGAGAMLGALRVEPDEMVLVVCSGAVLEDGAMGWLRHALATTGASAAFADHDKAMDHARGRTWFDPVLQAAPHHLELATVTRPPLVALFSSPPWMAMTGLAVNGAETLRNWLAGAARVGSAVHVPLLLSSELVVPNIKSQVSPVAPPRRPEPAAGRILVVIPTRDRSNLLSTMVESLVARAADPDRLDILVVDNGSTEKAMGALLARWSRDRKVEVLRNDEAFNWSRLNNLAARRSGQQILVFANNDMRMLSKGWDDTLRRDLADPDVGVVGARLIYPSGRVQHAGVVMSGLRGAPLHDGLGAERWERGPLDRWLRRRPASAVTGAFIAVRREVFDASGGFDEAFVVACNDIDFCLRIRSLGLSVLYEPEIELIHHESETRGHADTAEKVERAAAELARLDELWGDDVRREPSRNPHWISHEARLFHGVRRPSAAEIQDWIEACHTAWEARRN